MRPFGGAIGSRSYRTASVRTTGAPGGVRYGTVSFRYDDRCGVGLLFLSGSLRPPQRRRQATAQVQVTGTYSSGFPGAWDRAGPDGPVRTESRRSETTRVLPWKAPVVSGPRRHRTGPKACLRRCFVMLSGLEGYRVCIFISLITCHLHFEASPAAVLPPGHQFHRSLF